MSGRRLDYHSPVDWDERTRRQLAALDTLGPPPLNDDAERLDAELLRVHELLIGGLEALRERLRDVADLHPVESYLEQLTMIRRTGCPTCHTVGPCRTRTMLVTDALPTAPTAAGDDEVELPWTGLTLRQARDRLSGLHFSKESLSQGERDILFVAEGLLRLVDGAS